MKKRQHSFWNRDLNEGKGAEVSVSYTDEELLNNYGQCKYEDIWAAIARTFLKTEEENIEVLTRQMIKAIKQQKDHYQKTKY